MVVVVVVVCRVLGAAAGGVILSQGGVGRATPMPVVVDKVLVI